MATVTELYQGLLSGETSQQTFNVTVANAGSTIILATHGDANVTSATCGGTAMTSWLAHTGSEPTARNNYFYLENVGSGSKAIVFNYTGWIAYSVIVLECTGVPTSGAHDQISSGYSSGYNVTNIGTGTITPTGTGTAIAICFEGYGVASNCVAGTGWTTGSFDNTADSFWETRACSNGVGLGGTSGQATGTGSGCGWHAAIMNVLDDAGAVSVNPRKRKVSTLLRM